MLIAGFNDHEVVNRPNDATLCYDRIIPNHAMLSAASHAVGCPPLPLPTLVLPCKKYTTIYELPYLKSTSTGPIYQAVLFLAQVMALLSLQVFVLQHSVS